METLKHQTHANGYREASYLLTRYLLNHSYGSSEQSQSCARIEYDPPWRPSASTRTSAGYGSEIQMDHPSAREQSPRSDVVVELGSGMGTASLAAAEALQRLKATLLSTDISTGGVVTHTSGPDRLTVLNEERVEKGMMKPTTVVLTDLPEVCMLLRENVSMQLDDWKKARLEGITVVDEDNAAYEKGSLVELRVRKLSWGNQGHVKCLSKELRTLYPGEEDINLTILCSDLVCSRILRNVSIFSC